MTKAYQGLYVDVALIESLKEKASKAGCSISGLAELLLKYGLTKVGDEALRAWADRQPSTRGRLGGALTGAERRVFAAFDVLKAAEAGTWRYSGCALANASGLKLTDAFLALQRLKGRGLVNGFELEAVDRWGRPVKSYWCLAADEKARKPAS